MKRKIFSLLLSVALSSPAWAIQYSYDNLNRLTRVTYDSGARIDYGYDAAGNILSIVRQAVPYAAVGTPTIQRVAAGNGKLTVYFAPPANATGIFRLHRSPHA